MNSVSTIGNEVVEDAPRSQTKNVWSVAGFGLVLMLMSLNSSQIRTIPPVMGVSKAPKKRKASTQVSSTAPQRELSERPVTQPEPDRNTGPNRNEADTQEAILADDVPGTLNVPAKRGRGRPRKLPVEPSPPGLSPTSTTTRGGRIVKKSEKAIQELRMQARKLEANQITTARRNLRDLKAKFTL